MSKIFFLTIATKDAFKPGDCIDCPIRADHEHNMCILDYKSTHCPLKEQLYKDTEDDYEITD